MDEEGYQERKDERAVPLGAVGRKESTVRLKEKEGHCEGKDEYEVMEGSRRG